jgi:AraC-like DNA-binding protein
MNLISFDQYCQAVRLANVNFILTRREEAPWWLEYVPVTRVILQFGGDGGASVVEGTVTSESYLLLARYRPSSACIAINGEEVLEDECILLTPGGRFVISADGPRSWLSLTIPRPVVEIAWSSNRMLQCRIEEGQACIVPAAPDQQAALRNLATALLEASRSGPGAVDTQQIEDRLLETARRILSGDGVDRRVNPEYKRANEIVATALSSVAHMDFIDSLYVDDLARVADVHSRTLLRAFNRVVGMGPVRYLRFRQLNAVRRKLNEACIPTVTAGLQLAGVADMGRFSGLYRGLFGEAPSETLRTAKARRC